MPGDLPRWLRASAASLALFVLLGAGQLLPAFHFAFVVHRVCAEHGELVHDAGPGPQASRSEGPAAVAGGDFSHQHEHCGLAVLPRTFGTAMAAADELVGSAGTSALSPSVSERAAHIAIELLAYAPKLAPPV